ncbi:MAG: hypothetical protein HYU64_21230 [Armatimonadetes bacterium]|nr:hypothetical protein [Armatimonadota bacterium]
MAEPEGLEPVQTITEAPAVTSAPTAVEPLRPPAVSEEKPAEINTNDTTTFTPLAETMTGQDPSLDPTAAPAPLTEEPMDPTVAPQGTAVEEPTAAEPQAANTETQEPQDPSQAPEITDPTQVALTEEHQKEQLVNQLIDGGSTENLTQEEREALLHAYGALPAADLQAMVSAGFKVSLVNNDDPRLTGGAPPGTVYGATAITGPDGAATYLDRDMFDPNKWTDDDALPGQMDAYRDYIVRHEAGHAMFAINYATYGDDFAVKITNQYRDSLEKGEITPSYVANNNPLHYYTESYAAQYTPPEDVNYPFIGLTIHGREAVPDGMEQLLDAQAQGKNLRDEGLLGWTNEAYWQDQDGLNRYYTTWEGDGLYFRNDGSANMDGGGPWGYPWRWDASGAATYNIRFDPGGPWGYPWRYSPYEE